MKILFLLFPLILLLVQGAAGNSSACRRRGGFCTFGHNSLPSACSLGCCWGMSLVGILGMLWGWDWHCQAELGGFS
uniref:Uncharacterized protein n=1 Tax=Ficedula albicollis TaxID=59894 RepID=A0A803VX99_FICAL